MELRIIWRRFYKAHREDVDMVAGFVGLLSMFISLYGVYLCAWMVGGR